MTCSAFSLAVLIRVVVALLGAWQAFGAASSESPVQLLRTPNGGRQPQAALDGAGVLHLIYYQGDPKAGDVYYVKRPAAKGAFSAPVRVNSQAGSAIAVGTIRGAQLAVGKGGRVHVIWNGSERAGNSGKHTVAPLLYARLNDSGTAFEPERDLITYAAGLDGGSSIAADAQGRVYALWHARAPGQSDGEEGRAVFVARSEDEGRTFERERPITGEGTGVCACCGMRAFADQLGSVYVLFRSASAMTNRDEVLLVSRDQGQRFRETLRHRWISATCPMSSATLNEGPGSVLAAWETAGQVYFARVQPESGSTSTPAAPTGKGSRKHPVAVSNGRGEVLLAWAEGTGWAKGGALAWQRFDAGGNPIGDRGKAEGVPVWSLPTAVALRNQQFLLIY